MHDDEVLTWLTPDEHVALIRTGPQGNGLYVFRALAKERALVRSLEERVAFAEQARDNAVAQREDVIRRSKQKSETAGRIIAHLTKLMRTCSKHIPDEGLRAELLQLMDDVLADNSAKV